MVFFALSLSFALSRSHIFNDASSITIEMCLFYNSWTAHMELGLLRTNSDLNIRWVVATFLFCLSLSSITVFLFALCSSLSLSISHLYLSSRCVSERERMIHEQDTKQANINGLVEWELVVIGNSELDAFIYEHDCMKETLAFSCFWTIKPACVPLYVSFFCILRQNSFFYSIHF